MFISANFSIDSTPIMSLAAIADSTARSKYSVEGGKKFPFLTPAARGCFRSAQGSSSGSGEI